MILTEDLVAYLNGLLQVERYKDYAPNGLQVEGKAEIRKIVTGVTASQALIEAAIDAEADAILVHHGYFWKSEPAGIVGFKQKRIKALLEHDINLIAYHLPLDGHDVYGNNAQLGKLWQLQDITPEMSGLVRLGELHEEIPMKRFIERVSESLQREVLHLPGGSVMVQKIAWCSGGAQSYIDQAIEWGADVYISGEVSEQTTHLAAECGIHYLAAGHHATERLGVKSLGEHINEKFGIECRFIDMPNPV
ncbi:Nif3-like dinuclear metal center hexameric protein [Thiomicrorhabdus heinhorstiae]|uniref:Nif3-like dinuclear metal center hexameric protein n=1 Tax=Thiomicrorhabdus heinhorstiae TaxID=2748010 RepID=A0ABS0BWM8_9GAMM|nr:Nif3-like dinuclear metal center hexameric protein [Thiomicrorhabdus heinhorstiae]MBF6057216.1 Nif3-like dinuclear metal center hexameric protein [Thiomicrorhabdus heinhorstiae]